MKKITAVIMAVMLVFGVIVPALSVSASALSIEINPGETYDFQMASETANLNEKINNYPQFRSYLREKLRVMASTIDVSSYKIPKGNVSYLTAAIFYDIPEAFHVYSYSYSYSNSTGYLARLTMQYSMTSKEYSEVMAICDNVTESFIGDIKNNSAVSEAEKAVLVHDRLIQWCQYDYANYLADTIPDCSYKMSGVFEKGTAVCAGYADAYRYALEKMGMECYICSSDALFHDWNIVVIDGEKYHVDTTWDDPVWDTYGTVLHENVLLSTEGIIAAGHDANDFDTSPTSKLYENCFWTSSNTEIQYKNGAFYYFDNADKYLKKMSGGTVTALKSIEDIWNLPDNRYYLKSYVKLDSDNHGNYLFYSTPTTVYKYDLDTNTAEPFYSPELPGNYHWIYGFKAQNDYFYLNIFDKMLFDETTYDSNIRYKYYEDPAQSYYTITYDFLTNGGDSTSVQTALFEEGSDVDLSPTAFKQGYEFKGWYDQSGSRVTLSSFKMPMGNLTLYAVFSKLIWCRFVTYSVPPMTYSQGNTVYNNTLSTSFPLRTIKECPGWTAVGWSSDPSPLGKTLSGTSITLSESTTFYSIYEKDVVVSYDTVGGSAALTQSAKAKYSTSENYFYPEFTLASAPVKAGFTFTGWLAEDGTVYNAGDKITPENSISLTAQWELAGFIVSGGAPYDFDSEEKLIYGGGIMSADADSLVSCFENPNISVDFNGCERIATGAKVQLIDENSNAYDTAYVVVFGDVNGDGWYDGTDSVIVNCIANGLLSKEQVGAAAYRAADCDGSGTVDADDVRILELAGVLLGGVDLNQSPEELSEDSVFTEYLNLIEKNIFSAETADAEMTAENTAESPVEQSIFKQIAELVFNIITVLLSMFFNA